jgi:hypothetical protein
MYSEESPHIAGFTFGLIERRAMFTRLTEFKLSNDEYATYPVVLITDQHKSRTVSAVVHDEQGERWIDFPFNFHNLYLIGRFQADEVAWFEAQTKKVVR